MHEIEEIIGDYKLAAEHAIAAGFDGVQLHAATSYLLDQFLRDETNRRADSYCGGVENRIRILIEATQALISVAGADRMGVRLSPNDDPQGPGDSESELLFTRKALTDRTFTSPV
jgi:N-ethylmaleimide reductase